jgi:hypothetical protein
MVYKNYAKKNSFNLLRIIYKYYPFIVSYKYVLCNENAIAFKFSDNYDKKNTSGHFKLETVW